MRSASVSMSPVMRSRCASSLAIHRRRQPAIAFATGAGTPGRPAAHAVRRRSCGNRAGRTRPTAAPCRAGRHALMRALHHPGLARQPLQHRQVDRRRRRAAAAAVGERASSAASSRAARRNRDRCCARRSCSSGVEAMRLQRLDLLGREARRRGLAQLHGAEGAVASGAARRGRRSAPFRRRQPALAAAVELAQRRRRRHGRCPCSAPCRWHRWRRGNRPRPYWYIATWALRVRGLSAPITTAAPPFCRRSISAMA